MGPGSYLMTVVGWTRILLWTIKKKQYCCGLQQKTPDDSSWVDEDIAVDNQKTQYCCGLQQKTPDDSSWVDEDIAVDNKKKTILLWTTTKNT